MSTIAEARYQARVPRYTSYPTATQFHPGVGESQYIAWLKGLAADAQPASLYVHVPYCRSLCWFCACHTRAVRTDGPVERYTKLLHQEIDLVATHIGRRQSVRHVHLGGGTPTVLSDAAMARLADHIRERFELTPDAEFAIEIDPRTLTPDKAIALRRSGVNRASLGVQDVNPAVQRAIHRWQPLGQIRDAVAWLHDAGIGAVNIDLMYGLPYQSVDSIEETSSTIAELRPQRIALFGYAHVPWFKRNQKAIDTDTLPDALERLAQYRCASQTLVSKGYVAIGLDHFALPGDTLARAQRAGALRRNFQGYTTDAATTLIGLGLSAIGRMPQGFVQNAATEADYRRALAAGRLPTIRGREISSDDALRGAIIERLMCDLRVDITQECAVRDSDPSQFAPELDALGRMCDEGLVTIDAFVVEVPEAARPMLRNICAVFDSYLPPESEVRAHSMAV